jgi:hypothetical protein
LPDAPSTPTFSSVTSSGFTVNWTAVTGAASYRLDIATDSGFTSFVSGYSDRTVSAISQAVTGLSANTLYYARVRTVNSGGTSSNSTSANTATLKNEPTAHVTGFATGTITTSSIPLSWSAASPQPDGYLIRVSSTTVTDPVDGTALINDLSLSDGVAVFNVISGATTSYSGFTGFVAGTSYTFKIYPYNNSGTGIDYLTTSAPSVTGVLLPDAPSTPTFSSVTSSGFTVNWTAVTGAGSYRLDIATDSGFTNLVSGFNNLTVSGISQAVTGLSVGTTYYARLRTVNSGGTSANSTSATQTTTPANDLLSNAASITVNGSATSGGFGGSTPQFSSSSTLNDVWYKFVATSTSHTLTVAGGAAGMDPDIRVYEGTGASFDTAPTAYATPPPLVIGQLAGVTEETVIATNFVAGRTYFVMVQEDGTSPGGSFTIQVRAAPSSIATWNPTWSSSTAPATPLVVTSSDANLSAGSISRTGLTGAANSSRYSATGWNTTANYLQMTLTAASGFRMDLNDAVIYGNWGSSGTGPGYYIVRSSLDNFVADIGYFDADSSTSSVRLGAVKLPSTGYGQLSTVTFRIYGSSTPLSSGTTTASTGTGGFSALRVTGTLVPIPSVTAATVAGTVGTAVNYNTVSSGSPTSYAISSGTLPAGLSLNTSTGAITGTPTAAGNGTVVSVTASNSAGTSAAANLTFNIAKATPIISVAPTASAITYGQTLASSSLTGGTPSTPGTFTFTTPSTAPNAGTASQNVTFTPNDTVNYNTASTTASVTVDKASQTITSLAATDSKTYGGIYMDFDLSATKGASTSALSYSSSNTSVATIHPTTGSVHIVGAGTTTLTVNQAADANYNAAPAVTQILTVSKADHAITFGSLAAVTYSVGATFNLAAYASSGLTVSYASSDTTVATVSGSAVTILKAGSTIITASQAGNGNYNAATAVTRTLTVNPAAPSSLSYVNINGTVGTAITNVNPTVTGTVDSYSISPALPQGLSLNTVTGVISGTPLVTAASAIYTVTATNAGGNTSATLTVAVLPVAPSDLSYANISGTVGAAITNVNPTVAGTVDSYSISPALPAGLLLNTGTGVISGTPSAAAASAIYTVTATNAGGSTSTALTIVVGYAVGPVAVADSLTKPAGNAAYLIPVSQLLANDYRITNSSGATVTTGLSVSAVTGGAGNTASYNVGDRFIQFTPSSGASDTFTYTVTDGVSTATATVTVTTETQAPTFNLQIVKVGTAIFAGGNTTVRHDFIAVPNQTYLVEYATDLNGTWTSAGNQSTGTTGSFSVTFTTSGDVAADWTARMLFRARLVR